MAKKVSMQDVADKAGVSRTTVSYVINDIPGSNIPTETKERIWAVVKKLGYRSNAMARGLRGGKSHVLGFITDNIADTPFIVDIIKGAQDSAFAANKILLVMDAENSQENEARIFQMMDEWQVEGVIYATTLHREIATTPYYFYTPTILVDCFSSDQSLSSVVPDEVQGGYVATKTLINQGHHRIGFINGPVSSQAAIGRLKGYLRALDENGISFCPALIRNGNWWQETGYDFTLELMSQAESPTAIFCGNDWMAMGAYDALKKIGKSIPRDVAIIGFDNREMIAAHMHPALTTVALPYYEMGKQAMAHLLSGQNSGHPVHIALECPLVLRESV
ncbi:MAG: LacI family transcriptional regulator [Anaerolinea sp.]|nr:LacI family transcriptional regulator [Anaerolinea sp.]